MLRAQGREVLKRLEAEERIGIVLLGRPYHNDPGINHEILEEFQKIGYPVLTMQTLPIDDDILFPLFAEDLKAGLIRHPMDIRDACEELLQRKHLAEDLGRQVYGAPP